MKNPKISFSQYGPKSIDGKSEIEIKWVVENNSKFDLTDVKAFAQFGEYEFGDIRSLSKAEHIILMPIPSIENLKKEFGENIQMKDPFFVGSSKLEYTIGNETFQISSNDLEIPL